MLDINYELYNKLYVAKLTIKGMWYVYLIENDIIPLIPDFICNDDPYNILYKNGLSYEFLSR